MVQASEIKDLKTLRVWLKGQPSSVGIMISVRAALRVMPYWLTYCVFDDGAKRGLLPLDMLRVNLASSVFSAMPEEETLKRAAVSARNSAGLVAAGNEAYAAAENSAYAAAGAATGNIGATQFAADAAGAGSTADASVLLWAMVRADAEGISENRPSLALPLWEEDAPTLSTWHRVSAYWSRPDSPYSFWLRWYESLLDPENHPPINPAILREIVLIDEEKWTVENAPEVIAAEIERLEEEFGRRLTPYGETVEFNPETAKLRVVPASDLPADLGTYAIRKLQSARANFSGDLVNQYAALQPELELIDRVAGMDPILPVEVFDTCRRISRRVEIRAQSGELPDVETDALLIDFTTEVRDTAMTILANDPKTQEMNAAIDAIEGNDALVENAEVIEAAVEEVAPLLEGVLAEDLPEDAAIATNPAETPEARKPASYRLASRFTRIVHVLKVFIASGARGADWTLGKIAQAGGVWAAAEALAQSPVVKAAIAAIYRMLGI